MSTKMTPETDFIKALAELLQATDLTEIEVEKDDLKVRVARTVQSAPVYAQPIAAPSYTPQASQAQAPTTLAPATVMDISGDPVTSPMVGTVYHAASPDKPPFVSIGTQVKKGQTLLIVEAMKTFNEIPSPRDGIVKSILVENGQPVEFGEHLLILE